MIIIVSPVDSAVGGHGRGRPGVGVAVVGGRLVLGIEVGVEEGQGRVPSVVISIRNYGLQGSWVELSGTH